MRWLVALVLTFCSVAASAERRVALVVGNSAYAHAPALANPVRDANAIAGTLERLDFEVLTGIDQTAEQMRDIVRAFSVALDEADLAVFYYAGHGIQVAGRNYLIPVDADIRREADVDFSTLRLDLILAQMERAAATRIVLLDACRNNPFENRLSRAMGRSRAVAQLGNGLAPVESEGGAFIGFATDPGAVAFDGAGDHSPFTEALLRHLEAPGLEINSMMTRVRADVFTATGRQQRPWSTSSLLREVYLAPRPGTSGPPRDPRLAELAAWEAIAGSETAADYARYLKTHPDGLFRDLAAARLAALAPAASDLPPEIVLLDPGLPFTGAPEPGSGAPSASHAAPAADLPPPALVPGAQPKDTDVAVAAPPALLPPGLRPEPRPAPRAAFASPYPARGCSACPATVILPGGATRTGSDRRGENPVTRQVLAPFAIATAEITVGDIRRYETVTGRRIPRGCFVWTEDGRMRQRGAAYWGAPGFPVAEDSPAACLNWDDATAYADWLNTQDPAGGWRLPSEAEFEYAARGGQDGDYPWKGGLSAVCTHANGADLGARFKWRNTACSDGHEDPQPAGAFPPNGYGLHAMIGNLWEWTGDCWNPSHRGANADGSARATGTCSSRVLRGGSWDDPPDNLRVTYRVGIPGSRRQANVGFRLVRDLP